MLFLKAMLGSLLWMSPPALAAHVMYADIPQRHAPVLRVDLGIVADEHLEHIRLGAHHSIVDGAPPLRLVDRKGIGALPQQILCTIRMPACMHALSFNVYQTSLIMASNSRRCALSPAKASAPCPSRYCVQSACLHACMS